MIKTWQVVLATIAIFVAGLVTGGAVAFRVVRWISRHPHASPAAVGLMAQHGGPASFQQFGPQLMRSFENRLDLTAEQRSRIEPIVSRTAAQLGRNRREVQLTSALAIEKMQDEIGDLLTADQRVKFEELIAQQRARLQQFRRESQPFQGQGAQPQPK
jgi:Spy/CpxP family protein refolding chaperone